MTDYVDLTLTGAQIETALGLAESALQSTDIGVSVQAYDADTAKLDGTAPFTAKQTFSGGYEESGSTLTQSGASLTIPIDGKTYKIVPSEAITSVNVTKPTAPACSGCTVHFVQGATGYAVSQPSDWLWADGTVVDIDDTALAHTRLVLITDPDGNVHADASVRAV